MNASVRFTFPVGILILEESDGALVNITYTSSNEKEGDSTADTPLLREAVQQLNAYFMGTLETFSLPIHPSGTDFQNKVWQALRKIPYGTTATYRDIAIEIGSPNAFRAVGNANHANPLPIIIPCHRIIQTSGAIGGYAGGANIKAFLLELERNHRNKS